MKFSSKAGTSLIAISRSLTPVVAVGAGLASAAPAQAQSVCTPNALGVIICAGAPALAPVAAPADPTTPVVVAPAAPIAPVVAGLDVAGSLTPVPVILQDGFQSANTVAITTLTPGSNVDISALGTAVINTVAQPGLLVNSGAGINAQITDITTAGDGATGALLRAVDDVVFVADGTISTVGANAPAIDAQGRSVAVTANTLSTVGDGSNGAILHSLNGPASLTADLITTNGNLSDGALIQAAGNTALQGGAIRTGGTDAVAFDVSNDAAACVLLGAGGCTNTVNLNEVTTNGFGGVGGLVTAAGNTNINIGALRTGGDQAAGLNLSTAPAACIALGVGSCGTAFTVQNLTTQGANSPGALVRAGGPIVANVGVLQTNGDQAIGLDLASQPDVCAVVGAGNCGTSFSVGQLTTNGVGATGVLARIAGPTTGNVGVLRTNGNNATGIDIASDPTVCAIVGGGGCDVNLVGQDVSTGGNGAAAVLINAVGNVTTNLGAIATAGDNATGLGITENPGACLAIGPGRCAVTATTGPVTTGGDNSPGVDVNGAGDPTDVTTGPVTTGGDGSTGVAVTNPGPTTVTTGPVTTGGENSPGVDVDASGGDGPTTVTTGAVTTGGANSPGVRVDGGTGTTTVSTGPVLTTGDDSTGIDVTGTGPITVAAGTVSTSGTDADGIDVSGGAGPVTVTAGAITTSGGSSDGINVITTSGDQSITAGPIAVTGLGSNGIVATSPGCSNIRITATDDISAAQGAGILASSACAVTVTTLPGASVIGRTAGIDVTSGTGSTITIGDSVAGTAGPAIDAHGAAATVTITPTGSVTGYVNLTDGNDTLTNNGTFNATANSDFGAGTDAFVNAGRFFVRPNAASAGAVTLTGLESFTNSGTLDMRNGVAGDTLTLPGSFTGTGASTLGLDVTIASTGASADKLVIGGAATGSTTIALRQVQATPGVLVNNLVLVDAGAGSSPTAFTLGTLPGGLVRYDLAYNAATNDYALYGTPDTSAYRLAKLEGGAREVFYRTSDAISDHMQSLRDSGNGAADDTSKRSSALWGQMFGSASRSNSRPTVSAFGQSRTVNLDNNQDFFGGQIGYDFGSVTGRDGFVFGVTGGYANSMLTYRGTADHLGYQAVNGGGYASIKAGPFFLDGLGKYEHYWIDVVTPSAAIRQKLHGNSYGGRGEVGLRLGSTGVFLEPAASIEYVHTDIDTLDVAPATLDFGSGEGLRGKAGARLGVERTYGVTAMTFYIGGHYVHEFKGEDDTLFSSGGETVGLGGQRIGDYGRGTLGLNVNSGNRVSGFIEAFGDYSSNYKGGGGRGGLSVKF